MDRQTMAASALNRFGLGARVKDAVDAMPDPQAWLLTQCDGASATTLTMPMSSADYLREVADYRQLRVEQRKQKNAPDDGQRRTPALQQMRRSLQRAQKTEFVARQQRALTTPDAFAERIVRFWSNHFAISVDKRAASPFAAPMEREAIRPHAFGYFGDLLLAVETHPGMLLYLDNAQSVGTDSRVAERAAQPRRNGKAPRTLGLNENLAREILELHTLGVAGGYSQADVTELARAITGWSLVSPRERQGGDSQGYLFRAAAHEPGARIVLGKRYAEDGEAQGRAIVRDLALHPATARHIAFKLARHFVADDPPPALVGRMAAAYLGSGGALPPMYRAMVGDDAAWQPSARKFKTPDDLLLSALRALGISSEGAVMMALDWQAQMGQPLFQPRSPAGFADGFMDWSGPDAIFKRVQAAQSVSELVEEGGTEPAQVAVAVLGSHLDVETLRALQRAESLRAGYALLMASPTFQWRV